MQKIYCLSYMYRNIIARNLIFISRISNIRIATLKLTNFNKLSKKFKDKNEHLTIKMFRVFKVNNKRTYNQFINI